VPRSESRGTRVATSQDRKPEAMTKTVYAAIGVLWLCSLIAGPAVWGSGLSSLIAASSAEITAQPMSPLRGVTGSPRVESGSSLEPRVDLLGNEIEDAVADYRIDLGGDVYERHSPETAVPKLGSPSS
jgi:hypothetical protein